MSKNASKKKETASSRVTSSQGQASSKDQTADSKATPLLSQDSGHEERGSPLWPDWNDDDVNAEKWEAPVKVGKETKPTKTPPAVQYFDDPDGNVELPQSLKVHSWKRASEMALTKELTVVKMKSQFNLLTENQHLFCSEFMRAMISEIHALWEVWGDNTEQLLVNGGWRPWEHIYSLCSVEPGHEPLYNPYGKYVVKLYWMGCWKKIIVDDVLPYNEDEKLLLPVTTEDTELWSMLLAKAFLKLANVVGNLGAETELGEFSIIHTLTGWIPEVIPMHVSYMHDVWNLLSEAVPSFQYSERKMSNISVRYLDSGLERKASAVFSSGLDPEMVVCARYQPPPPDLQDETFSAGHMLCELSQLYTTLVTRTRDCALFIPSNPDPISERQPEENEENQEEDIVPENTETTIPVRFIEICSLYVKGPSPVDQPFDEGTEYHGSEDSLEGHEQHPEATVAADINEDENSSHSGRSTTSMADEHSPENKPVSTVVLRREWLLLEQFVERVQALLVFHKSETYPVNIQEDHFLDTSKFQTDTTPVAPNQTPGKPASSFSPVTPTQTEDETTSHFLLVDSVWASHVIISFSSLARDGEVLDERNSPRVGYGSLIVKPVRWRSVALQMPLLHIQTSATRAAVLALQPGRHILCILIQAPLGFHIHLCSTASLLFGDEDTVLQNLCEESLRFTDHAASILRSVRAVVDSYTHVKALMDAVEELQLICRQHGSVEIFKEALVQTIIQAMKRKLTQEEAYAIQDLTSLISTGMDSTEMYSKRTRVNLTISKRLQEMWNNVEAQEQKHGKFLLRHMFNQGDTPVTCCCYEDEQIKALLTDYTLMVPDHTSNSWFLLFREVFFLPKEMLIMPKVYCPLHLCFLHVIDNDTGEEFPHVFHKHEPRTYRQNQLGYTLVVEAQSGDVSFSGVEWRLRLIRSCDPPAAFAREVPVSSFSTLVFSEYYNPHEALVMCRLSVKVTKEYVATIQMQTSSSSVYFKLSIFDHDREVLSKIGRRQLIVPIFWFQPESSQGKSSEEEQERDYSDGPFAQDRVTVPSSKKTSLQLSQPPLSHKYIIQAEVLQVGCLDELQEQKDGTEVVEKQKNRPTPAKSKAKEKEKPPSKQDLDLTTQRWTLRVVGEEADANCVQIWKDTEREEEIQAMKQAWEEAEPGRAEMVLGTRSHTHTHTRTHTHALTVRTGSHYSHTDYCVPLQARQSRLKFLSSICPRVEDQAEEKRESSDSVKAEGSAEAERVVEQTQTKGPDHVDITPFLGKLTEEDIMMASTAEQMQLFREQRSAIMQQRVEENEARTELKKEQMDKYDELQNDLDKQRELVTEAREEYVKHIMEEDADNDTSSPSSTPL